MLMKVRIKSPNCWRGGDRDWSSIRSSDTLGHGRAWRCEAAEGKGWGEERRRMGPGEGSSRQWSHSGSIALPVGSRHCSGCAGQEERGTSLLGPRSRGDQGTELGSQLPENAAPAIPARLLPRGQGHTAESRGQGHSGESRGTQGHTAGTKMPSAGSRRSWCHRDGRDRPRSPPAKKNKR